MRLVQLANNVSVSPHVTAALEHCVTLFQELTADVEELKRASQVHGLEEYGTTVSSADSILKPDQQHTEEHDRLRLELDNATRARDIYRLLARAVHGWHAGLLDSNGLRDLADELMRSQVSQERQACGWGEHRDCSDSVCARDAADLVRPPGHPLSQAGCAGPDMKPKTTNLTWMEALGALEHGREVSRRGSPMLTLTGVGIRVAGIGCSASEWNPSPEEFKATDWHIVVHGYHPDPEIDAEVAADAKDAENWDRAHGVGCPPAAPKPKRREAWVGFNGTGTPFMAGPSHPHVSLKFPFAETGDHDGIVHMVELREGEQIALKGEVVLSAELAEKVRVAVKEVLTDFECPVFNEDDLAALGIEVDSG
jgi:hypothetical protein